MDSVGIGELPDAAAYGDQGSNTLGNIARNRRLQIPTLRSLGLPRVVPLRDVEPIASPIACYGRMAEASAGKDSVTGHWEIAGIVLDSPFPTFPRGFPQDLLAAYEARIGRRVLGNTVASGTAIIDALGAEHMRTGLPIVYTSADSVFQIAAHEEIVPVPELYRFCEAAYEMVGEGLGVGRVIARPFVGVPGRFTRTANRKDYALPPRGETLLDRLQAAGWPVVAVGKIEDLFAGRGVSRAIHTASDDEGMDVVERMMEETERGLIFANLVDFDTQFGHRNDVAGYAANIERFDARLAEILPRLRAGDLLVVTADHGNDPTTPSTDHSREYVPLLVTGPQVEQGVDVGTRSTFADLGQTLADLFGVGPLANGTSFLREIRKGDSHTSSPRSEEEV
ncbi:MAG: phosphopentomutase [Acidobacteria bacterium]|nr:phosphopentomutase [Acidobacteriota bacterium]